LYLKSLILRGFKSFADKMALTLEPGVTVVVGPNGSGKSNIADAVMWVLGEQSARSLRGGSMEDVIFAGSAGRDPVGVAEVALVLDNSDHTLPIEFSEVTVSRRMFRSGESEYMINNSPCRLLDVQELLSDSGLGRDTTSIISQGGLDDTVNGKPEDRRLLLEEAAAIIKHKKRKERALKKLDLMESNTLRARDVLNEVNRQLKPLEQQAHIAQEHDEIARELREAQICLATWELRNIQGEWERLVEEEDRDQKQLDKLRAEYAERDGQVQQFQGALEAKGVYAGDLGEQRRRVQAVLERINSGLLLLEEKGKNIIERSSDLRAKIHHSESKLVQLRREMARLEEEKKTGEAQLTSLYASLADERRAAEVVKKGRLAASERVEETSAAISHKKTLLAENQKEIQALRSHVKSLNLQREFLKAREAAVGKRIEDATEQLREAREAAESAHVELARRRSKLEGVQEQIDRLEGSLGEKRDEALARSGELAESQAKISALEELSKPFAAASPALAWLLSQEHKVSGLTGMVGDLIEVEQGYEKAIELALGSDLFCVVCKSASSVRNAIDFLREKKAGEIAFVSAADVRSAGAKSVKGKPAGRPAIQVLKCKPSVKKTMEVLLSGTYIVETLEEALEASSKVAARYVTMEGEVLWPSGKISLGALPEGGAGMLLRKRELAGLRTRAKKLEQARQSVSKAVAGLEGRLEKARASASAAAAKLQEAEDNANEAASKARYLANDQERMAKERADLGKELSRVETDLHREQPESSAREKENRRIEKELVGLEKRLLAAKAEHDERYRGELEKGQILSQCQVDIASLTERSVYVKRRERTLGAEIAELEAARTSEYEMASSLDRLRERIQPVHDVYAGLLEQAEHWERTLSEQALADQADSASLRERLHEAQEIARDAAAKMEETTSRLAELRVKKGQLEMRVNSAVGQIVDEYDTPIEAALKKTVADEDVPALRQRARSLATKMSRLGAINPMAMEEYRRLNDRREFLAEQLQDLVSSKKALQKVVAAIDAKMREQFMATFEEVNKHFQDVFSILFPGGRAELFLTDPDDPFSSGVDIEAQPSGKKLQKMSLLSSGERALVAIALLFAIHHSRPSPFYVLDEVEAALDDLNLQRFIGLLEALKPTTQFIVISHQRRTMETANCLYGVSMQADGVSRLVSQKLPAKEAS